jgi:hypothetical protein
MGKLTKYADDMVTAFTGKMAPDRVGTRYDAVKSIATAKYAVNGLNARSVIETVRGILSNRGIPVGKWGIHIAFALKIWKMAKAYAGVPPASVVDGFISEYTLKGGDPATLTAIAGLVAPASK